MSPNAMHSQDKHGALYVTEWHEVLLRTYMKEALHKTGWDEMVKE